MPKRRHYLWVCENERPAGHPKGCCVAGGSREIREALKKGLAQRRMQNEVRVCTSSCLDLCWAGPAIAVMPEHVFYGHVTLQDVPDILDALQRDSTVERLVLPDAEFDSPES